MHHHQPHVHMLALGTILQMVQQHVLHVRTNPQIHTIPARAAVQTHVAGHVMRGIINLAVHVYCANPDTIVPGTTVGIIAPTHTRMHQRHCPQTIFHPVWNLRLSLVVRVYLRPTTASLCSGSQTHVVDFTNIFTIIPVPVDMSQIHHRDGIGLTRVIT